jgi:NAD(P)H dehydrogenase (quinone)
MYAVLGVTGQVGGAAAKALLKQGKQVRAIVRDAAKGQAWAEQGAEIAIADMLDAEALQRAFTGTEGVYVMLPPYFYPSEGFTEARAVLAAVRTALEAARPPKFVALSTVGAHRGFKLGILEQLRIMEDELGQVDLPRAFIRAAWFMDNAQWDLPAARDTGVIPNCLSPLDRKIPMVSTIDVGAAVARTLQQDWTGQRIIELEGPEACSPADIAETFGRLLERQVLASLVPREWWEALFEEQGAEKGRSGGRLEMLDGFNSGWIAFELEGTEHVRGQVTLEQALAGLIRRG